MVEAKILSPDANHAPEIKDNDAKRHDVEHCFSGKLIVALEEPEAIDSCRLGSDTDNEKVSELEGIVGNNAILEGGDNGNGCVQRVPEQEITD